MDASEPCDDGVVIGVDIGGTKTALLATDIATGADLAADRYPTPAEDGPTAGVEQLFAAIDRLMEETGRPREALKAIGVAVPGLVDVEHGRVIQAGNLAGWRDIPLRDIIGHQLNLPAYIEHDAAAAALGEKWRGAAKQMHNFAFLALGTGVGVGLVINGRIHRGFHHAAGEAGNFVMGRQFLGRTRGGHGNLEMLIGGPALREDAKDAIGRELKVAETFKRADRDERLEPVAAKASDYIAMAVINIAALLDPEAIIFGGGTAGAGQALIERVRARVERELPFCPALIRSTLGEDAQLHGAVFGALWQLDPDLAQREELR